MDAKRRGPIGIELVKRGLVNEEDINRALEYQKENPNKKIIEIINTLSLCDEYSLIQALGDILDEKAIILTQSDVKINPSDYISIDVIKNNKAIPFEIAGNKIKVCFADTLDRKAVEIVRLILLNKGLIMEKYITFEKNINQIIETLEGTATDNINSNTDTTGLVDSIIKTAIKKRASDIHIEPLDDQVRVRYRIDGELVTAVKIPKEKQSQIIGRLKAISNMYQEKQESQDGRIIMYPDYNIRVSSQRNIYGEKFVLRLLKKNMNIRGLEDLGFPGDDKFIKSCFNKRNSITIVAAPTGEGKTTTLYSIIDYLDKPEINITTIEDPVEIRIAGLNQIEINEKLTFSDSLRTVLRQDPDIILVGEIRDRETAEIAVQAGQTGHYVLSTIHTIDSIEVITRLRKMGVSNYDISSTVGTSVSQRLVRKVCKKCARKREFNDKEKETIKRISEKYNVEFDLTDKYTYDTVGCKECNNSGYYDRIGIFEVLSLDDNIKELIVNGASSIEIRKEALKENFKPLVVDGIKKVIDGITTLDELDRKIILY
ncbi:type IV-A pilus assembly ATPase PilB [Clostridium sp. CAG:452]|jgi:type IV pilus assembly protein PilB|nr:type IV-A pilus assembly ATPase PilB [Clostridium sp. CAG:452]